MSDAKSILIVEDEAMIGMMLEDYLDALGYRLHAVAATVDDACAQARQGGFDGALLDCNLQGEKSWPVADILVEKGIPFVFATGGMADDLPPAHADRPTLAKPFTIGAVERALGRILPG
ncbi:response regulator [Sphingobium naphthae]|jgi:DNA-binding response OmpR family regulator|uniref:Response regulator n=1 Tax=Sphingobium naphthae TaxID=1886786 RepID=A0ABU3ZYH1_9SPHN|nr:response regulator [Sphingobium naphthae]MDV5824565.1 response regulator [Sphingobium naphthae]MEA3542189.1 response regulator [Pseudomonadota bacterium]|tara:strand:- start:99 stop:455 length:357 start_codon:yes stop_codon:yes gene_type:complete